MNPQLALLQPYPFQKLRDLFAGATPDASRSPVNLSIGEPRHATPAFIHQALVNNLDGLARYPVTQGSADLREAIAAWLGRRFGIPAPDPARQVIPVNGSREALFAFAQAVVNPAQGAAVVMMPNPFYQIYEGAALLAGARPYFLNTVAANGYKPDFFAVPVAVLDRTQLLYVCSPGNPTGAVLDLDDWEHVFALADRHDFVIASDECYSEIYHDERNPPPGAMQAARALGRDDYRRLVVFSSLSKRSNVPGMRSGFVAGDAAILEKFLLYRTYHGCAMSPTVQAASVTAWNDEAHVIENRRLYREKFDAVTPILAGVMEVERPPASFYLWAKTPGDDAAFARELYERENVIVLPGSYLAREAHDANPGRHFIRIALVEPLDACVDAAHRIARLAEDFHSGSH